VKSRPIPIELTVIALVLLLCGAAGAVAEMRSGVLTDVIGAWSAALVFAGAVVVQGLSRWPRFDRAAITIAMAILGVVGLNLLRLGMKWWSPGEELRSIVAACEGILCLGAAGFTWFERRTLHGDLPAGWALIIMALVVLGWPGEGTPFGPDVLIAAALLGGLVLAACIIAATLDGVARGRIREWIGRSIVCGAILASVVAAGHRWGVMGPDAASALDGVDFHMRPRLAREASEAPVTTGPSATEVAETAPDAVADTASPVVVSVAEVETAPDAIAVAETPVPETPVASPDVNRVPSRPNRLLERFHESRPTLGSEEAGT
jgi:hypothetical protein